MLNPDSFAGISIRRVYSLAATAVVGLCLAMIPSGCMTISCYGLDVPFSVAAIDDATGQPVPGATIYRGESATRTAMITDRVLSEADSDGILFGTAFTFIHTPDPYTEAFRNRFRRIRVMVSAPGYAPHPIYVPVPEKQGVTVDLGTIRLNPVSESTQFDAKRLDFTVAGAPGFIIMPPGKEFGGDHPWLWYAPTFIGSLPNGDHDWYFKPLLEAGFFIAGVEVGESFGSPKGTAAYQAFYEHVVEAYNLSPTPVLLPQSRGGLMLYNWAVEHPDSVGAVAGIYTVCSITSYPGVDNAAPAYEMTPEALRAALKDHDPIERLAPLAKAKVPIFHIHGDVDTVVPIEANAGALVDRYRALGGEAEIQIVPGKGHEVCDEFFKDADFLAFVLKQGANPVRD